jgi:hypothetical protein
VQLGWLRGVLTGRSGEVVTSWRQQFSADSKFVPGTLYHRPGGESFAWGLTVYDGVDTVDESLPPILDLQDGGLRSLERVEGSFFEPGGGGSLRALEEGGFEARRLDVAWDFYGVEIDPVIRAFQRREYTGFRSGHIIDSSQKQGGGRTLYIGSRSGGGSFFRFYEKGSEQREKYAVLRIEYQAMGSDAAALFSALCQADRPREIAAGVLRIVDFQRDLVKLRDHRNQSRAESYRWWEELLSRAGDGVPFDRTVMRVRTIEQMLEWMRLSLPKPLAKIQAMVGVEGMCKFLCDLATCDRATLNEFDRELVRRWKESGSEKTL